MTVKKTSSQDSSQLKTQKIEKWTTENKERSEEWPVAKIKIKGEISSKFGFVQDVYKSKPVEEIQTRFLLSINLDFEQKH